MHVLSVIKGKWTECVCALFMFDLRKRPATATAAVVVQARAKFKIRIFLHVLRYFDFSSTARSKFFLLFLLLESGESFYFGFVFEIFLWSMHACFQKRATPNANTRIAEITCTFGKNIYNHWFQHSSEKMKTTQKKK